MQDEKYLSGGELLSYFTAYTRAKYRINSECSFYDYMGASPAYVKYKGYEIEDAAMNRLRLLNSPNVDIMVRASLLSRGLK